MQIFVVIAIIILFPAPVPALGEQPLEALQRGIDKGINVLSDPQYQDPTRFWHIADANTELQANDLVCEPGQVIQVPER